MIDIRTETILTVAEAARRLGKHSDTIRAWIRAEKLDGVEIAGKLHTSLEAIERASQPVVVREKSPTVRQMDARDKADLECLRKAGIAR